MAHYADTSQYSQEEIELWNRLIELQKEQFKTSRGLEFTYQITGNELLVYCQQNNFEKV